MFLNSTRSNSPFEGCTSLSKFTSYFNRSLLYSTGFSSFTKKAIPTLKDSTHFNIIILTFSDLSSTPQCNPHFHKKQLSFWKIHLTSFGTPHFHRSLLNSTGCSSIPQEATLLSKDAHHFHRVILTSSDLSLTPKVAPQFHKKQLSFEVCTSLPKILLPSTDLSFTPKGSPHLHRKQLSFRRMHFNSTGYSSLPQISP